MPHSLSPSRHVPRGARMRRAPHRIRHRRCAGFDPAATPAAAPDAGGAGEARGEFRIVTPGFKALFKDTLGDFKHFATDKEPLLWMAGGGVTALAFHPLDDDVNARLAKHDTFFDAGKVIGYGAVQIGAAVATWGIGRMVDKRGRAAHMGLDLLRAQIVTQSVTYALKYTVRRDRPDGTSGYAFPSGHASTTFATASVLERHFGWKAGVPTYILATYIATSRSTRTATS